MNRSSRFACFVLGVVLLALAAGCGSIRRSADRLAFQHRAAQSATFARLTPEQQSRLERGEVMFGDTRDMVYLACGNPDRIDRIEHGERWIYEAYLNSADVVTDSGPPSYRQGNPTLIRAVAFREGVVTGVMQRR